MRFSQRKKADFRIPETPNCVKTISNIAITFVMTDNRIRKSFIESENTAGACVSVGEPAVSDKYALRTFRRAENGETDEKLLFKKY